MISAKHSASKRVARRPYRGHNATALLHELLLAHSAELLPEDIANMIHAHPTISEAIMETMRGINRKPYPPERPACLRPVPGQKAPHRHQPV